MTKNWKSIWTHGRNYGLSIQSELEKNNSIVGENVDAWNPYKGMEPESFVWTSGFFCAVSALLAAQVDALKMGVTS